MVWKEQQGMSMSSPPPVAQTSQSVAEYAGKGQGCTVDWVVKQGGKEGAEHDDRVSGHGGEISGGEQRKKWVRKGGGQSLMGIRVPKMRVDWIFGATKINKHKGHSVINLDENL